MQQPPSEHAGGAGSELRSDAQQLGSSAANRLRSEVDSRKGAAASQAQSVSAAIRQTADGLDDSAPDWLRSALQQGARQIQRFADGIEKKDSRELMSEAQSFARNNPGTFLAACAAAGFAAARIFKAGGEQQNSRQAGSSQQASGTGEQNFGGSQSHGQQFDQGSTGGGKPFMASGKSAQQSGFQSSARQQPAGSSGDGATGAQDDPLVLGTGGEAGRPIGDGDLR